jgi:hypothetical protein
MISSLELKFRGRNAWPQFRSFRPGYYPWHLVGWEVGMATTAFQQASEAAVLLRDHRRPADPLDHDLMLVRRRKADGTWETFWRPVPEVADEPVIGPIPNNGLLQEVRAKASRSELSWEVGLFDLHGAIAEPGLRPYYPVVCVSADRDSGFLFSTSMLES